MVCHSVTILPKHAADAIAILQDALLHSGCVTGSIKIFGEIRKDCSMYRSHPNFQKFGHWYDWANIRWPGNNATESFPSLLSCIFQVDDIEHTATFPSGQTLSDGGTYVLCRPWTDSPYVVDKSGYPIGGGSQHEEMHVMYSGELDDDYWIAKVDWIQSPSAVVEDITIDTASMEISLTGTYTAIASSSQWGELFLNYARDSL
jgi:hypothetical protein